MASLMTPDSIGPYELRGVIGEGAFSIVRLACLPDTDNFFACKIIPRSRLALHNLDVRFENEIRISQQLRHDNIVQLFDLLKDESFYYIIMEFCPNGELFQYIVSRNHLEEVEAQLFIRQILEALKYVHAMGVCHRDLKPENILLDQYGRVKISDFGLSRFVGANGLVDTPCGSPCYASPECVSGRSYDGRKSDIWSCGVILYAMLTGQLPWTKRNQHQLFEQIRKGEYIIPGYLSDSCRNFIQGLMTVDISRRFTIDFALNHPWLASPPQVYPVGEEFRAYLSLKEIDLFFDRDIVDSSLMCIEIEKCPSMVETDIEAVENVITKCKPNIWLNPQPMKPFQANGVIVRRRVSGTVQMNPQFSKSQRIPLQKTFAPH